MPRKGAEIGRGAEGVIYENLDDPGWVIKEYHPSGVSPLQARNEFANLERARAIRPDNVVRALAPADPRQGFLIKERVVRDSAAPVHEAERQQLSRALSAAGVQDAEGNLIFGHTEDNPAPRWMLIE